MNDQANKNEELEVNRRNREEYEQLMEESSTQLDGYYDKNNWFIRILLFSLLAIIVIGTIIVFAGYLGSM